MPPYLFLCQVIYIHCGKVKENLSKSGYVSRFTAFTRD